MVCAPNFGSTQPDDNLCGKLSVSTRRSTVEFIVAIRENEQTDMLYNTVVCYVDA